MLNWVRLPDLNFTNVLFYCWQLYMKSNPRLNSSFDLASRYSGLSRRVPSSSRRPPSSSRRDFVPFVSSLMSSSRHWRVRLVDSPDRLVVIWSLSSRRRFRLVDMWERLVVSREAARDWVWVQSSWCAVKLRGVLHTAINKIESISSSTPNARNGGDNQQLISSNLVAWVEANWRWADNWTL